MGKNVKVIDELKKILIAICLCSSFFNTALSSPSRHEDINCQNPK